MFQLRWERQNLVLDSPSGFAEELSQDGVLSSLTEVVQTAEKGLQVLAWKLIVEVDDVHCARERFGFGRGGRGVDGH